MQLSVLQWRFVAELEKAIIRWHSVTDDNLKRGICLFRPLVRISRSRLSRTDPFVLKHFWDEKFAKIPIRVISITWSYRTSLSTRRTKNSFPTAKWTLSSRTRAWYASLKLSIRRSKRFSRPLYGNIGVLNPLRLITPHPKVGKHDFAQILLLKSW